MIEKPGPSITKKDELQKTGTLLREMKRLSEKEIGGDMMSLDLNRESVKYMDLIKNSRFKDRISFLISNPHLAEMALPGGEKPCCWGTIAYILNANLKVSEIWAQNGHRLDDRSDALGDYVVLPENCRPGYVGREPMELFLAILIETGMEKDSVAAFFWQNQNNEGFIGFGLGHSGIYLGKYGETDIIFEQKGLGERFRFISINDFVKELSQESRSTLKIRYYRPPA